MIFSKLNRLQHRERRARDKVTFLRYRLQHKHIDEARRFTDEKVIQLLSVQSACIYLAGFTAIALFQAYYPDNLSTTLLSFYATTASLTILFSITVVVFAFLMLLGVYKQSESLQDQSYELHDHLKSTDFTSTSEQYYYVTSHWNGLFSSNWLTTQRSLYLGILSFCLSNVILAWISTYEFDYQAVYGSFYITIFFFVVCWFLTHLRELVQ